MTSLLNSSKSYMRQAYKTMSSTRNTLSVTARKASALAKDLEGQSEAAAECMILEDKYGAHNYHPVSSKIHT